MVRLHPCGQKKVVAHRLLGHELLLLQGVSVHDYPHLHDFSDALQRSLAGNAMSAAVVMFALYGLISAGWVGRICFSATSVGTLRIGK